jgi:hypothetical protein
LQEPRMPKLATCKMTSRCGAEETHSHYNFKFLSLWESGIFYAHRSD